MGRRAVFFDRDGVLNRLAFNPGTGEFESPRNVEELQITEKLGEFLRPLQDAGYAFFLISNQPSYAKGKTTLKALQDVHEALDRHLKSLGFFFQEYYYCYHHPDSVVPELKVVCECRKPLPYFLEKAFSTYDLDRQHCWMIGDQDTDAECGKAAGIKTILLEIPESSNKRGASIPDALVPHLHDAIRRILK